jgi:hypothetical protein
MVTDQKHSSDSTPSEQNAEAYTVFFRENSALKKELKYYHSQHNTLERRVKRLKRDVGSLKVELLNIATKSIRFGFA